MSRPSPLWACPDCIRAGPGKSYLFRKPHCTQCGAEMVELACPCGEPITPVTKKHCCACGADVGQMRQKFDKLFKIPAPVAVPQPEGAAAQAPATAPEEAPAAVEPAANFDLDPGNLERN